jgi:ParB-like chromosome segregation protein Spo0J
VTGSSLALVEANASQVYSPAVLSQPVGSRLLNRRVDDLRPHPAYDRNHLTVSPSKLSALAGRLDSAFLVPALITPDGTIIDGYTRWELARQQGRETLLCVECDLSEEDALRMLLQTHGRSDGLNPFCRIIFALELEPSLKAQGQSNQQAGGRNKGSSKLTEADRIDTTAIIAKEAEVSTGSVSKVRQLNKTACPELKQALRAGKISIHRAWLLSKAAPTRQREELGVSECSRNIKKDMRVLTSRHVSKSPSILPDTQTLMKQLLALESNNPGSFHVFESLVPGKAIAITKELLLTSGAQQELNLNVKEP